LESLDTGKSFQTSKNVDINVVLGAFRYMAGWTDKLNGQVLPSRGNFFQYTK
jgi:aldehyde dehydrogenase (NAD+)